MSVGTEPSFGEQLLEGNQTKVLQKLLATYDASRMFEYKMNKIVLAQVRSFIEYASTVRARLFASETSTLNPKDKDLLEMMYAAGFDQPALFDECLRDFLDSEKCDQFEPDIEEA